LGLQKIFKDFFWGWGACTVTVQMVSEMHFTSGSNKHFYHTIMARFVSALGTCKCKI